MRESATFTEERPKTRRAPPFGRVYSFWMGQERAFRSLAIIPASSDVCALEVASLLAHGACQRHAVASCVVDLRAVKESMIEVQLDRIEARTHAGSFVFVALRSIFDSDSTEVIARTLDAAMLCVGDRKTSMVTAKETIERIGRERFIGSLLVRGS
jgi:hypothetical protein